MHFKWFTKAWKGAKRVVNRTNRDLWNNSIAKISQNTEIFPGDLKKLNVTQAPVKDHHLTLVG